MQYLSISECCKDTRNVNPFVNYYNAKFDNTSCRRLPLCRNFRSQNLNYATLSHSALLSQIVFNELEWLGVP